MTIQRAKRITPPTVDEMQLIDCAERVFDAHQRTQEPAASSSSTFHPAIAFPSSQSDLEFGVFQKQLSTDRSASAWMNCLTANLC
jgi:hypothetical protein